MKIRARIIGCLVLVTIALATWRYSSPPAQVSAVGLGKTGDAAIGRQPTQPFTEAKRNSSAPPVQTPERGDGSIALDERTLVGTKWARDGFALEFGPAGRLLIGGRERAQWRIEGRRVRLYRDATGEEHWLDIAGTKLLWNGQEIGRIP